MHGPVLFKWRACAGIESEWKIQGESYVYRATSGKRPGCPVINKGMLIMEQKTSRKDWIKIRKGDKKRYINNGGDIDG